jgi:DNA-binding beta-propeller fold protein YncE
MATGAAALVLLAVAVALALRGAGSSAPTVRGIATTGTAYVETNVATPDANSVLALRYADGSFRPLRIDEYPTGGSGSADLTNSGVLDADQQLTLNAARTLLFAVNQGSDSIAVFHIGRTGALTPVTGSPFSSGGTAPASLAVHGDVLVVANKAHDGIRKLATVAPNYTTFTIASDGALHSTGSVVSLPPKSSPTQVYVPPAGGLVFATEESGVFRVLTLSPSGHLAVAPGSPDPLPDSLFTTNGPRPVPVWPAGLSTSPTAPVLYSGIPNYGSIVAYDYDTAGRLRLDSQSFDGAAYLPCWSVVSPDGHWLYFANAATDNVSVWDLSGDPRHPRLHQTVALRGGGNPWNLRLDPAGHFLYIITPRQVRAVPPGQGQLLHSLRIAPNGTVTEIPSSPVPLPVALDTNPFGLAVVPDRPSS